MALVNIESALRKVLQTLKKLEKEKGLEILSYKRNRGLTVIKKDENLFWIRERGYLDQEVLVTDRELQRLLKSIMKREFPRSRKVRVYSLSGQDAVGLKRKKL